MHILIISVNRNARPSPVMPAGACIVAEAAERKGNKVRLLDLMFEQNPAGAVDAELEIHPPDVVGLSVRNIDNNDIYNPDFYIGELRPLMDAIRKKTEAPVVLGGAAVGVMPEELLRYSGASCAVTGDGETVFPELLASLGTPREARKTPGTAWLVDGVLLKNPPSAASPSDGAVVPDYRRWVDVRAYLSEMSTVPIQTKLGCHFKCVYCTYRKIEGDRYRCLSPEQVVDAVKRCVSGGLLDIEFVDNVFNSPYAHAMAVCEALACSEHGARLQSIELNPGLLDSELLDAMEDAGFGGVGITAESASDAVLGALGKSFSSDDVHRAAEVVRARRLRCLWIFMLGGPGETESSVRDTLRFAERHVRPGDVAFFNVGVRIYPGTGLEAEARETGLLSLEPWEMLRPVFYLSPDIDFRWLAGEINRAIHAHLNFIDSDAIHLSFLSRINRTAYSLGVRPPLWKHTRLIRRGLRFFGADA